MIAHAVRDLGLWRSCDRRLNPGCAPTRHSNPHCGSIRRSGVFRESNEVPREIGSAGVRRDRARVHAHHLDLGRQIAGRAICGKSLVPNARISLSSCGRCLPWPRRTELIRLSTSCLGQGTPKPDRMADAYLSDERPTSYANDPRYPVSRRNLRDCRQHSWLHLLDCCVRTTAATSVVKS